MDPTKSNKRDRLHRAAIVRLKYQLMTGNLDLGFQTVFQGVLTDLEITEDEVEAYIQKNREELKKICLEENREKSSNQKS